MEIGDLSNFIELLVAASGYEIEAADNHTDDKSPAQLEGDCHPQWNRYCHTAVDLFTAATAGWDPISSEDDFHNLLLTESDIDRKVANHLIAARSLTLTKDKDSDDTHNSFEILRNHFDMGSHSSAVHPYSLSTKRRASSPLEGDEEMRRISTDNLSLRSSASGYTSGRASSFSSINSAYGALHLESPSSGLQFSSGQMSPITLNASGESQDYTDTQTRSEVSIHPKRVSSQSNDVPAKWGRGSFMCDCCPKEPKAFDTREQLRILAFGSKALDRSGYNPAANTYKRARRRLHPVVDEIEQPARVSQEDLECPICMGELFRRVPILQTRTTGTTTSTVEHGVTETKTPLNPLATQDPDYNHRTPPPILDSNVFRWLADDVVSLRICQHTFHARCLTTWFMTERYDCPVCRAVYWGVGLDEKPRRGGEMSVVPGGVEIPEHLLRRQQPQMTVAVSADVTIPPPAYQRERSSAEQSTPWAGVVV
ncbi:RING-H2 finger protein ATL54 [Cytospora mali]|uniref:RING-H2 finger protein ATL54 n=1 Tax=Cytospora mali TaxID=578113 RepID=A0A194V7A4_CYTMA|nr:RING-H2 finger protein ATL54 [Valsa mali var. pyri (nom. inval.)]